MTNRRWFRGALAASTLFAALAAIQGCSSSSSTTTTDGTIALSISPVSATVQVGGITTVTGTVTRGGGFTGDVAVTVEGVPTGVIGTLVTAPTAGTSTAVVSIAATGSAAPGTYTLTVRAKASGLSDATASFILTIAAATSSGYTFTVAPQTLSVAQGASGSSVLTFVRTNFTGTVGLSVDNLPTGVTAAFTPATGATSTLTLTVGATAAAGTTSLVVRGTVAGLTDVTATLPLTVTATTPTGGFTIALTPAAVSLAQSGTTSTPYVKATRTGGFAGTITYTITGAPAGLTATAATTATPDSIAITLTASASLAAAVYPLVIHANATGLAEQTTPLSVTITATGTGGGSVRLDYSTCATTAKPIWVGFQDGSGAWTHVTGTGDVYTFSLASSKAGIAVVTQPGTTFSTSILLMTSTEAAAYTGACGTTGNKTVTGTLANTALLDRSTIALGGASTIVINPTTAFTLTTVANGTFDLIASKQNVQTPGVNDRIAIRRDLNIASGGTIGAVLDFTGAESFAPLTATTTIGGVAAGETVNLSQYYATGAACTLNPLFIGSAISAGTNAFTAEGVPSGSQRTTDYHVAAVQAVAAGGTSFRLAYQSNHSLTARTVTLGASLSTVTVTAVSGSAYKRLQVSSALPADYTAGSLSYSDAAGNSIVTTVSPAYLGSSTLALVTPDLGAVAGVLTSWFPAVAATVNWTVAGTSAFTTGFCSEGALFKLASTIGTN